MNALDVEIDNITAHASIACVNTIKENMIENGRLVIIDRFNGVVKGADSLHSAFNSWSVGDAPRIKIKENRTRKRSKKIIQQGQRPL